MKMKWHKTKLGNICKLYNGRTYKASEWKSEGLPIIRIQNLKDSSKSFNYWNKGFDGQVKVSSGNLLLAWSGTPGTSFGAHIWNGPEGVLNQHIFRVDLDESKVVKEWAMYSINAQLDVLIGGAQGGVGLKHVTKGQVENLDISVPSTDEQLRIVKRLTLADELIAKRKASLRDLDNYLRSLFIEMFGDPKNIARWPVLKIEELASSESNSLRTGPFGSDLKHSEFVESGIAVLGIDNVVTNEFRWDQRRYITEQKYEKLKRYTVRPGDVLITIMGTVGRSCVVPDDIPVAVNTKHLAAITLDRTKALPEFISKAFLIHPEITSQLKRSEKGAIMAGLNLGIIKGLTLNLPPIELQEEFVTKVNNIKNLRCKFIESDHHIGLLMKSLLNEVFQ